MFVFMGTQTLVPRPTTFGTYPSLSYAQCPVAALPPTHARTLCPVADVERLRVGAHVGVPAALVHADAPRVRAAPVVAVRCQGIPQTMLPPHANSMPRLRTSWPPTAAAKPVATSVPTCRTVRSVRTSLTGDPRNCKQRF